MNPKVKQVTRIYGGDKEIGVYLSKIDEETRRSNGIRDEDDEEAFKDAFIQKKLIAAFLLRNGGHIGIDCKMPEIRMPETAHVFDAFRYQRATEETLVSLLNGEHGVRLFRNTVDGKGNTYGAHDNFSTWKPVEGRNNLIIPAMLEKLWSGTGDLSKEGVFHILQRANFIECIASEETTESRALLNERDEPHTKVGTTDSAPGLYRFHHISNDNPGCPRAIIQTKGMMHLFLLLDEHDLLPAPEKFGYNPFEVLQPANLAEQGFLERAVVDLNHINHQTKNWIIPGMPSEWRSALKLAKHYHSIAETELRGASSEIDWILDSGRDIIERLSSNSPVDATKGLLDWSTKLWFFRKYAKANGVGFTDPYIQSCNIDFHRLDKDGWFAYLEDSGVIEQIASRAEIEEAKQEPPQNTRAYLRGKISQLVSHPRMKDRLTLSVGWNYCQVYAKSQHGFPLGEVINKTMTNPFHNYAEVLDEVETGLRKYGLLSTTESLSSLVSL